jgi:signal peptidase I
LADDISLRAALFSFRGRLGRARYWEYSVLANIATAVFLYIAFVLFSQIANSARIAESGQRAATIFFFVVALSYYGIAVWIGLALQIKRLHDRGRAGWFVLLNVVPILGILLIFIDTYLLAGNAESNRYGSIPKPNPRSSGAEIGLVLTGLAIVIALIVAGRSFVSEPFLVPSGSNEPTITSGDDILVSRYAYWAKQPERGDMVVFINPHTGEDYVKRVIGLPGDTVQLNHGIVSINGQAMQRARIADYHDRQWNQMAYRYEDTPRYRYVETFPGGWPHEILGGIVGKPEDSMPQDNTSSYRVPAGRFFTMGDSRDNSNDSRLQLGYVPLVNIVGRVEFCLFSRAPDTPWWKIVLTSRRARVGSGCLR